MRPLKPYLLAVGGLIAAVFSTVFLGTPARTVAAVPTTAPQPDLQSKSLAPSNELLASREARPANKTPAPQPHSASPEFSRGAAFSFAPEFATLQPAAIIERLVDRRALLLVGVIELRI